MNDNDKQLVGFFIGVAMIMIIELKEILPSIHKGDVKNGKD